MKAGAQGVLLVVFVHALGFGAVLPILPRAARDAGASEAGVGLLVALYAAAQLVANPLWGRASDRLGRAPVLSLSLGMSGVGLLVVAAGVAGAPYALALIFVGRLVDGAFAAVVATAQAHAADLSDAGTRAERIGRVNAAFGAGIAVGAGAGGALSAGGGSSALPITVAAILALAFVPLVGRLVPATQTDRASAPDVRGLSRTLAAHPIVLWFSALLFLHGVALTQVDTVLPLWNEDRVFPGFTGPALDLRTGLFFAFQSLLLVLAQALLVGPMSRRLGEPATVGVGAAVAAAGLVLMGLGRPAGVPGALVGVGALGFGSGLVLPALAALVSKAVDRDAQGGVLGVKQGIGGLGRAIGPAMAGTLYAGAPGLPFVVAGALLGAVALATLAQPRRGRGPTTAWKRLPPPGLTR